GDPYGHLLRRRGAQGFRINLDPDIRRLGHLTLPISPSNSRVILNCARCVAALAWKPTRSGLPGSAGATPLKRNSGSSPNGRRTGGRHEARRCEGQLLMVTSCAIAATCRPSAGAAATL